MKTTIKAAVVLALASTATVPAVAMEQELDMLGLAAESALDSVGLRDVDISTLTVSQLAIIQGIIGSDDSEQDKRRRIEAVISR